MCFEKLEGFHAPIFHHRQFAWTKPALFVGAFGNLLAPVEAAFSLLVQDNTLGDVFFPCLGRPECLGQNCERDLRIVGATLCLVPVPVADDGVDRQTCDGPAARLLNQICVAV